MNSSLNITPSSLSAEWLEADGHGGFASGTVGGIRTRRYHALRLTATTPPTGRLVLANGFDAWIETPAGRFALTSQRYAPDVIGGDGAQHIQKFTDEPWPTWTFKFADGTQIAQEIFVAPGTGITALTWKLLIKKPGVKLFVRPFFSGRDYHSLHKENSAFRFEPTVTGEQFVWQPYDGLPGVCSLVGGGGHYTHDPHWYRNFLYAEERDRGLDATEDLASPGIFDWDLSADEAIWLLAAADSSTLTDKGNSPVKTFLKALRKNERTRRNNFPSRLHRAADSYIVNGRHGKTIIAGYPWFADWGRDTFIAVRGLCLAGGRLEDARDILVAWANSVSEGMLPNLFPDHGSQPEYNSVDASLWYVIAAHELLQAANGSEIISAKDKQALQTAIEKIITGYANGTRFGIRKDSDGLLACGVPGVQLTWMDAKVGDWVVTPRIGKPVEIQALWLNALKIAGQTSSRWENDFQCGLKSFREKFWNEAGGFLFDVVDADHQAGKNDASFRPNQIFAVGGLPFPLIEDERAGRIVAAVQEKLLTPLGLRSLAPGEPDYKAHYEGGVWQRDGAYHQGTVWPWLIGPFVEAWMRVHGATTKNRRVAREQFLAPLLAHLDAAGLGHISEIADAEPPFTPRGCPFQAWSVGEVLRLDQIILAEPKNKPACK